MSNTFGYIRVSTKDQNEARQLAALEEYQIPRSRLFIVYLFNKTTCYAGGSPTGFSPR